MSSEICVLGPVRLDPETGSGLGGPRQRRLLAALVIGAGNVVPADRLVDIVFEGSPTEAAPTTLRSWLAADACHRAGRNLTADEWRRYMPEDTPYRPTCPEWPVP